jgi:hypothetical protein
MLKLVGGAKRADGTEVKVVVLGFSSKNIERLQKGESVIFPGEDVNIPNAEFIIFAGKTEQSMIREFQELIGPHSQVKIDPRTTDA